MADHSSLAKDTAGYGCFCILAWNHLQIAPNGTVKLCCIAGEDVHDDNRPLNVYLETYEEIWNAPYMREARRRLAAGEEIAACRRCFDEERLVGQSRRLTMNKYFLDDVYRRSAESFIAEARDNDWRVAERPHFLQLNMGNQCNLACRMCSSQYSSKIEQDDVHNKWMPSHVMDVTRWHGDRLVIGPRPVVGVDIDGCHGLEIGNGDDGLRWTSGQARVRLPLPARSAVTYLGLEVSPAAVFAQPLRITVNGRELYAGALDTRTTLRLPLAVDGAERLDIAMSSGQADIGGRMLGVAIHRMWLERDPLRSEDRANSRALMRFSANAGWWQQPSFLFDEVLGEPQRLRRLIVQGGEPLIMPEFENILDHLVTTGASDSVILEIVSNMTVLKQGVLENLGRFKAVELICSIDGIKGDFEYIRWPARWETVADNIVRLGRYPNINMQFSVAVQAYNIMRIADLLCYCDSHGITVHAHFLVGPAHLNVLVVPPAARHVAMDRIEAYLRRGDVLPPNRSSAEYMVSYLRQQAAVHHRHLYRPFMLFTNDMDASRGQAFAATHAELFDMLRQDGLEWTPETRFAARGAR